MARAKKKENLTPEERLQAALVPENEQPYKVPKNWCWCFLGNIAFIRRGASPRPIKTYVTENEAGINWIKIGDTNGGKYITHVNEKITEEGAKKSVFVEEGTLLLSNSMSFGHPYILKVKGCIHDGWLALTPSEVINKEYLYYALLASEWYFEQVAVGTAVRNLNSERVAGTPTPLPTLPEQQRIVDRIENLFAKLDEAKQKAQDALDSFETRKAAILHKAFNGELTAQWRKDHGVGLESWDNAALQDVCEKIVCGKTPTGFIHPTGEIPYLKVYNIVDNKIDFKSTPQFIPKEIHEGKLKSSILKPHDVIMNIVGPPLRKIAIIPDDYPEWNMNQAIVRFRPYAPLQYHFLYYALVNPETLDSVISETKGVVGQANISVTQSRNLVIPLPSANEQTEIVRILDDLLAKEQQAKEAAEGVLEQIDLIKKAILARAFRGELGTNDPSEESAVELLKQVL